MGVTVHKPTTPGRRKSSVDDFSDITKNQPEKLLTSSIKRKGGRNNQGKITVRHRGGGAKRRYRAVDFKLDRYDVPATIIAIEYDPNRNARIALVEYTDAEKRYVIASHEFEVGQTIISSSTKQEIKVGNRMPLEFIPAGIMVYNVELVPGQGGLVARSAGNGVMVQSAEGEYVQVKMPSGEIRIFDKKCSATVGQVSNPEFRSIRWGKAGRMRHRGIKPTVRGKAMNPVDHPHGGGEGNQPIGLKHPKTPQGKPALGVKTRSTTKASNKFIIKRRNKRK